MLLSRLGRSAGRFLVSQIAGGEGGQLGGGGRVWFADLRAGLGQQGQRTLLGIKLKR